MKNLVQKASTALCKVAVNGHWVHVPPKATLLDAAKAAGVRIPTLCYSPFFQSKATCRMCLVEVKGQSKPQAACHTPVQDKMELFTDTDSIKEYRKRDLQFMLSRHPNECMRCEVSGHCKLQDLVSELQVQEAWPKSNRGSVAHPEHLLHDHTSPAILRDMDKCIECGLCVEACAEQQVHAIGFAERGSGRLPVTVFDKPLAETDCISCGQCTLRCPVGALVERPDWQRVLQVLDAKRRVTVVQTAPATRVAIGEEFGFEPGTISTGRLVNALRQLGFDYVTDTNFSADLTIMEEANELLARVRGERPDGKLPLFTSCCPGWVNWIEINRPDLIPHLSTAKSPQQMHGAISKYGPLAKMIAGDEEPFVVSIMPCTAKKDEAVRPFLRDDVDAVLTTRELAKMIKHRNIPFATLSNDGIYDSPFGESSGAAAIFGASGGVLEAALRTAADALGIDAPIDWHSVRGVNSRVKEATVPGVGTVAVVNSIGAAVDLLKNDDWKEKYLMLEVMTCKGGCLGGGGEPKSDDPDILEKRAKAIYKIDETSAIRKSHENKQVTKLYKEFLGHPLSETSEKYLHATYAARRSPRNQLMRFLDAVDHRDGMVAASLFAEHGEWVIGEDTFGIMKGKDDIGHFVKNKLPKLEKLKPGMDRPRHRMIDHAEGTDVQTPNGEKVHFCVRLDRSGRIQKLARTTI